LSKGGRADRRTGGQKSEPETDKSSDPPPARQPVRPTCQHCGFPVPSRAWGCKNPCPNCGALYPLGDCSD